MAEKTDQGAGGAPRTPEKGDHVSFGENECVIEVRGLADAQPGVAGVFAVVDQYGERHLVEDLEPGADEPAWEIVVAGQMEAYASA